MKGYRKISILVVLLISSIMFSEMVVAQPGRGNYNNGSRNGKNKQYQEQKQNRGHGNSAGAPLDGGLLALLAGAGAIYVAKRKKKKNAE